jgi:hypothetical protein
MRFDGKSMVPDAGQIRAQRRVCAVIARGRHETPAAVQPEEAQRSKKAQLPLQG